MKICLKWSTLLEKEHVWRKFSEQDPSDDRDCRKYLAYMFLQTKRPSCHVIVLQKISDFEEEKFVPSSKLRNGDIIELQERRVESKKVYINGDVVKLEEANCDSISPFSYYPIDYWSTYNLYKYMEGDTGKYELYVKTKVMEELDCSGGISKEVVEKYYIEKDETYCSGLIVMRTFDRNNIIVDKRSGMCFDIKTYKIIFIPSCISVYPSLKEWSNKYPKIKYIMTKRWKLYEEFYKYS